MDRLRSYGSIVLAALLLVVVQLLIMPLSVAAGPATLAGVAPGPFEAPPGEALLFSSHARGVQIYECRNGQWAFHAPRAQLFDPEAYMQTGVHYGGVDRGLTPGPWWESASDGSRIRAGNPQSAPSPNPDSIPLLRLEVLERYGTGAFSQVNHVYRLNTVGGVGPAGECAAGAMRQVPYTADYYFYGSQ
jgi:hypothetical protein